MSSSGENIIEIADLSIWQGNELRYKWPSREYLSAHEVSVVPENKKYRLILPEKIHITHPDDRPEDPNRKIFGYIHLTIREIVTCGSCLAIPIHRAMWEKRFWTERFLFGWTIELRRKGDYITDVWMWMHEKPKDQKPLRKKRRRC